MTVVGSKEDRPSPALFAGVVGQSDAIAALRAAARCPVHAYLIVGPAGLGERALARGFGAALLCPGGGCGACETCRRALAGLHPDLVEVERTGASLSVDEARRVVQMAQRKPLEAGSQVLVVPDIHLARVSAPVLLKTLEEPPASTVIVLLAKVLPPEMATIASRCVEIRLKPLSSGELEQWLISRGTEPESVPWIVEAAGGSVERAELLSDDPEFGARYQLWRGVPDRLDGTGSMVAAAVVELLASADASVEPLRARHGAELERLAAEAKTLGERGVPRRKEIEDAHHRLERRWRTDELRAGLAAMAGVYRECLEGSTRISVGGNGTSSARGIEQTKSGDIEPRFGGFTGIVGALTAIEETGAALVRNPNEALLLEALLLRLSPQAS